MNGYLSKDGILFQTKVERDRRDTVVDLVAKVENAIPYVGDGGGIHVPVIEWIAENYDLTPKKP